MTPIRRRWQDHSNANRAARYAEQPEYREVCRARAREYKERVTRARLLRDNCIHNLIHLPAVGAMRTVKGRTAPELTFTLAELGRVLGNFQEASLRLWIRNRMFPAPIYTDGDTSRKGPPCGLYTEPEARALVRAMSEHQKHRRQFCVTDQTTIYSLFAGIAAACPERN